MPRPNFLKGSGMPRARRQHQHQGCPKFLKGGKGQRQLEQRAFEAAFQWEESNEEEDAITEELHAEIAADCREERRKRRRRRHEGGYNEAAQIKALECTILSAGVPPALPIAYVPHTIVGKIPWG